jgi:hypothetical protein
MPHKRKAATHVAGREHPSASAFFAASSCMIPRPAEESRNEICLEFCILKSELPRMQTPLFDYGAASVSLTHLRGGIDIDGDGDDYM